MFARLGQRWEGTSAAKAVTHTLPIIRQDAHVGRVTAMGEKLFVDSTYGQGLRAAISPIPALSARSQFRYP